MLLCVTVFSVTGNEIAEQNESPSITLSKSMGKRDMWDVQFHYPVGEDTGSLYLVGAAFDGNYFYCPEWASSTIYRIDRDGVYIDSFTISGVPNLIDLTYDGEYVYGAGQSPANVIHIMDMVNQTKVGQINAPAAAWNIAYDADADDGNGGFWIGQWQTHMTLIDRNGQTLDSITPVPDSVLGYAWDPWTQIEGYNGPFLWVFSGTSTGMPGTIKVIDLDTKTLIPGVEHNVAAELGAGIAGGLGFTTLWENGKATLYGMIQGDDNDYLFGYEISLTNMPPETPEPPSGPNTGLKGVEYTFTAVTTDAEEDQIFYMFDWGDGTSSDWVGPFNSGATGNAKHSYTSVGTFSIIVKAKDINGGESGWSGPHTISITEGAPIIQIQTISGGLFKVKTSIKNIGTLTATNINWNITLTGGAFIGKETSGVITSLAPDQSADISSKFIFGLGATVVKVTAVSTETSDTKEQSGMVLLFFIKL